MDEVQRMREGVSKQYGIQEFHLYSEPEAAFFLGVDVSTLKRWRKRGGTKYVKVTELGERKKRYMGIHIIDMLINGLGDE